MSMETTSDISDEEAPERSRGYELTASPWIGLHYKYEQEVSKGSNLAVAPVKLPNRSFGPYV